MIISIVLDMFSTRLLFLHQPTSILTSSLYTDSLALLTQPITVVSSENLTTGTYWLPDSQSFVKRVKRKGESTQPCGAPVLRITGLERELLTLTD